MARYNLQTLSRPHSRTLRPLDFIIMNVLIIGFGLPVYSDSTANLKCCQLCADSTANLKCCQLCADNTANLKCCQLCADNTANLKCCQLCAGATDFSCPYPLLLGL